MRTKFWLFGLVSLIFGTLIPSAFAAFGNFNFQQPFSLIFSLINDVFAAGTPYVGQDGFQRFMYWLLIFIAVSFGSKIVIEKSGGSDDSKKSMKRMFNVVAAVLATAGAYAASPAIMQSLGVVVSLLIPYGLIFVILFLWVFNKEFLKNHPRVKHLVRFLVYLFGLASTSQLADKISNSLTDNYFGNLAFQLLGVFFGIMTIYELVMIFVDGAKMTSSGISESIPSSGDFLNSASEGVLGAAKSGRSAWDNLKKAKDELFKSTQNDTVNTARTLDDEQKVEAALSQIQQAAWNGLVRETDATKRLVEFMQRERQINDALRIVLREILEKQKQIASTTGTWMQTKPIQDEIDALDKQVEQLELQLRQLAEAESQVAAQVGRESDVASDALDQEQSILRQSATLNSKITKITQDSVKHLQNSIAVFKEDIKALLKAATDKHNESVIAKIQSAETKLKNFEEKLKDLADNALNLTTAQNSHLRDRLKIDEFEIELVKIGRQIKDYQTTDSKEYLIALQKLIEQKRVANSSTEKEKLNNSFASKFKNMAKKSDIATRSLVLVEKRLARFDRYTELIDKEKKLTAKLMQRKAEFADPQKLSVIKSLTQTVRDLELQLTRLEKEIKDELAVAHQQL